MSSKPLVSRFVAFSAVMTAFSAFDLYGTGLVAEYFLVVSKVANDEILTGMFDTFDTALAASSNPDVIRSQLRARILAHACYGPIARNVMKLWYLGTWYELPPEWRAVNGSHSDDVTRVVSPQAYVEGLLWPAVGANPSGAKAPGYGSWQSEPSIPRAPANAI